MIKQKENNKKTTIITSIICLLIIIIIVKIVMALTYDAEATTNSGGTLTTNAYTNNSIYNGPTQASSWINGYIGDFSTTGQTGTITKVEACFDIYTTFTLCSGTCDNFFLRYSLDGNEGSPTTLQTLTAANVNYTDNSATGHKCYEITSARETWSWTNIGQINLHIDAAKNQGPDTFTLAADYLYIKVTYTPPDTTDPVIKSLNNPGNNDYTLTQKVDFNFTATDNIEIANCTLWGNLSSSTFAKNKTTYTVENNTNTNITINLADGIYKWNIECYDTNGNSDFYSQNYTVKIDTKPPTIALEKPENNNYTTESTTTFFFNVTDTMTTIQSCKLIIDDTVKATTTTTPVAEQQTINLTASLTSGDQYWWINCTDSNGWENQSEKRNISVNILTPTIQTITTTYEQGKKAKLTGENWDAEEEIRINITKSDDTTYTWNTTTNNQGEIDTEYNISYDHPTGQQNIYAHQTNNPGNNATNSFTITARTATVTVENENYYEGEQVTITGTGFVPNSTATVEITNIGTQTYYPETNTNGGFNLQYNLSYPSNTGEWTVFAYDETYQNLNDTDTFTVNNRVANLTTNKESYEPTETVTITGTMYSPSGTVTVTLKDEDTGETGPGYPKIISLNSNGGFTHQWNIDNTCGGNFSFNAIDNTYSELNDTANFKIEDATDTTEQTPNSAYRNSPAGAVDIGYISESDNNRTSVAISTKNIDQYLEINWQNSFEEGTTINNIEVTIEHYETSATPSVSLKWLNGATWDTIPCAELINTGTEANHTCDLSTYITNYTQANNISLRLAYRYSTGGGSTGYIDYANLKIDYSGASACTEWGNSAPVINTMQLPETINLIAGSTKSMTCNATVSDTEQDMTSANATFYYYLNSSGEPDNNNIHYTNSSCNFTGGQTKTVVCGFNIYYYANNGTWNCNITVSDEEFTTNKYNTTTIEPLYAINITPTIINYGNVALNAISNTQTVTMTNLGNRPLNISVLGYGGNNPETGNGLAMICDQQGNITIENEKYSSNYTETFEERISISNTPTMMPITIPKQTDPAILKTNNTYWQLKVSVDNQPKGNCNGSIIFLAEPS